MKRIIEEKLREALGDLLVFAILALVLMIAVFGVVGFLVLAEIAK